MGDCLGCLGRRAWEVGLRELRPLSGRDAPWKHVIFFPLPLPQLMQQQAALMASVAQGGYLNPMAAFAAAQMQQMAALNMNGLAAAPMTPTSGELAGANTGSGLVGEQLAPGWDLISAISGPFCGKST